MEEIKEESHEETSTDVIFETLEKNSTLKQSSAEERIDKIKSKKEKAKKAASSIKSTCQRLVEINVENGDAWLETFCITLFYFAIDAITTNGLTLSTGGFFILPVLLFLIKHRFPKGRLMTWLSNIDPKKAAGIAAKELKKTIMGK